MSANIVKTVASEIEVQSLTAIVGGFSFAAALSWMDLVRFLIASVVKVNKNGGTHYALTAILTTLLSIAVYLIIKNLNKGIKKPEQPIYAVTR